MGDDRPVPPLCFLLVSVGMAQIPSWGLGDNDCMNMYDTIVHCELW